MEVSELWDADERLIGCCYQCGEEDFFQNLIVTDSQLICHHCDEDYLHSYEWDSMADWEWE